MPYRTRVVVHILLLLFSVGSNAEPEAEETADYCSLLGDIQGKTQEEQEKTCQYKLNGQVVQCNHKPDGNTVYCCEFTAEDWAFEQYTFSSKENSHQDCSPTLAPTPTPQYDEMLTPKERDEAYENVMLIFVETRDRGPSKFVKMEDAPPDWDSSSTMATAGSITFWSSLAMTTIAFAVLSEFGI